MNIQSTIPQQTVDILAKGLYQEALLYGFDRNDILRFVNSLLQVSMQEVTAISTEASSLEATIPFLSDSLPLIIPELRIRSFQGDSDPDLLIHWLQDSEGQHFLRSRLSAEPMEVERLVEDPDNILGIIELPDSTPIGCMAFLDYDKVHHKAELRKLIGETCYRHLGFGKAASRMWIHYGLEGLGLRKIYLNTLRSNTRNIRINEELGFSVEGILRNEIFDNGSFADVVRMAYYRS